MSSPILLVNPAKATGPGRAAGSVNADRDHRKQVAIAAMRLFSHYGYDEGEGYAGHLAFRDPECTQAFWVNPVGVHLSVIEPDDLVLLDYDGNVLAGHHPVNYGALVLHASIHRARPDVIASAHFHSLYGRVWSATGRLLQPINQDACAFYDVHSVDHEFGGLPHTFEDGAATARALGSMDAAILKFHGLLTVGASVEAAAWRYVTMERACQAQVLSAPLGSLDLIPHEIAQKTQQYMASEESARVQFGPLNDYITSIGNTTSRGAGQ